MLTSSMVQWRAGPPAHDPWSAGAPPSWNLAMSFAQTSSRSSASPPKRTLSAEETGPHQAIENGKPSVNWTRVSMNQSVVEAVVGQTSRCPTRGSTDCPEDTDTTINEKSEVRLPRLTAVRTPVQTRSGSPRRTRTYNPQVTDLRISKVNH